MSLESTLNKARAFFDRNPDEVLTRADIRLKYSCSARTAQGVARQLIREGVPRRQLPAVKPAPKPCKTFPDNLQPAWRKAIEQVAQFGTIAAAATAAGVTHNTMASYLRDARRLAGVNTTADLIDRLREAKAGSL
jgi:hypothetical protein